MGMEKTLPWYQRIMFLIPVFFLVGLTVFTVIQYTKTAEVSVNFSEDAESVRRAKEILEDYKKAEEADL